MSLIPAQPHKPTLMLIPIGPDKEYMYPALFRLLEVIEDVEEVHIAWDTDPVEIEVNRELKITEEVLSQDTRPTNYFAAVARVREALRRYAVNGDLDQVYWHDVDMLPWRDIINRLQHNRYSVTSGVYPLRGLTNPLIPMVMDWESRNTEAAIPVFNSPMFRSIEQVVDALAFGFGCMLMQVHALRATSFREESYWENGNVGEDYQWCADFGHPVGVFPEVRPWHIAANGEASRIEFGPLKEAVTWLGSSWKIGNRFGGFTKGEPRFDLPEDIKDHLHGDEWDIGLMRKPRMVFGKLEDLVHWLA